MNNPDRAVVHSAEEASDEVLATLFRTLDERKNFKLEAGAGAGKTYSLIQALQYIRKNKHIFLPRKGQRVACLTYTNVACDEIITRTDKDPDIFVDTLHGFLWAMISPYQKELMKALRSSPKWEETLKAAPEGLEISGLPIKYELGFRGIYEDRITLAHNDIPAFAIQLFGNKKFRSLIADKFPFIFIDEYQDTSAGLAEAILSGYEKDQVKPVVGLFGDHWQQIYENTCGSIKHPSLVVIPKGANFRSDKSIINFLNKIRPELPQVSRENAGEGTVTIYHCNNWLTKKRKKRLPESMISECRKWLEARSPSSSWFQNSKNNKILMLSHSMIAQELGYPNLLACFKKNNSALVKKEDLIIKFLLDILEPAIEAFSERKYGELFSILGGNRPALNTPKDKLYWSEFFNLLNETAETVTIGRMLDLLTSQELFSVPASVVMAAQELKEKQENSESGQAEPSTQKADLNLRTVKYAELRALRSFLEKYTVYSTEHSVKGAEFDDVIVVVGGRWTKYDFVEMIAAHSQNGSSKRNKDNGRFIDSRNLFYVAASRAKHNLALLFIERLNDDAIAVLQDWAGQENVIPIDINHEGQPFLSSLNKPNAV